MISTYDNKSTELVKKGHRNYSMTERVMLVRKAVVRPNLVSTLRTILDHQRGNEYAYPSREVMSQDTGYKPNTISDKMKELEGLGLIERHKTFRRNTELQCYSINFNRLAEIQHPNAAERAFALSDSGEMGVEDHSPAPLQPQRGVSATAEGGLGKRRGGPRQLPRHGRSIEKEIKKQEEESDSSSFSFDSCVDSSESHDEQQMQAAFEAVWEMHPKCKGSKNKTDSLKLYQQKVAELASKKGGTERAQAFLKDQLKTYLQSDDDKDYAYGFPRWLKDGRCADPDIRESASSKNQSSIKDASGDEISVDGIFNDLRGAIRKDGSTYGVTLGMFKKHGRTVAQACRCVIPTLRQSGNGFQLREAKMLLEKSLQECHEQLPPADLLIAWIEIVQAAYSSNPTEALQAADISPKHKAIGSPFLERIPKCKTHREFDDLKDLFNHQYVHGVEKYPFEDQIRKPDLLAEGESQPEKLLGGYPDDFLEVWDLLTSLHAYEQPGVCDYYIKARNRETDAHGSIEAARDILASKAVSFLRHDLEITFPDDPMQWLSIP